jgi:hypothetical protein
LETTILNGTTKESQEPEVSTAAQKKKKYAGPIEENVHLYRNKKYCKKMDLLTQDLRITAF